MAVKKTFVFGIGAPKCGTTWLHAYLKKSRGFQPAFTKELHIWDAVFIPAHHRFRVPEGVPILNPIQLMRREMQRHASAYFDYFASLLRPETITHTADITPSYCGLTADQIRFVYNEMKSRGVSVKIVFLMRDPVERCWSMVRMFRKDPYLRKVNNYLDYTQSESDLLRQYALTENAMVRTNYQKTLRAINESGVSPQDVYIGFYESMFDRRNVENLSAFLNVEAQVDFANVHVHSSPKSSEISPGVLDEVALIYEDTYTEIYDLFPEASQLWRGVLKSDSLVSRLGP